MRCTRKKRKNARKYKKSIYPMKHISFQSIEQFRTVIKVLKENYQYVGQDENNSPIFDYSRTLPTVKFKGTVKLHGTNAGVAFNNRDGLYVQSRENIINIQKDNMGFAFFVESNKDVFLKFFQDIATEHSIDLDKFTIVIYGEWAGKGIQKGVAISELEKSLYIFGIKMTIMDTGNNEDKDFRPLWFPINISDVDNRIYNIETFKTFEIDIDLNAPELVTEQLVKLTEEVENECPVASKLGFSGIGEGIVWTFTDSSDRIYRFKTKGEKHSVSKVKTIVAMDVEKINSIKEFVDYAVTQNRFDQAIQRVFESEEIDIKKLGNVIKWMFDDVCREELDTMVKSGLEPKSINGELSKKVKELFFKKMNENI